MWAMCWRPAGSVLTGSGRELLANEAVKKRIWAADYTFTLGALETERPIFLPLLYASQQQTACSPPGIGECFPTIHRKGRTQHESLWKPVQHRRAVLRDGPAGARPMGSTVQYLSGSLPPLEEIEGIRWDRPQIQGSASRPPGTVSQCRTSSTARPPGATP